MTKSWEQLYEDLHNAYEDTRKTKVGSIAHVEFEWDLEINLHSICTDIYHRRYSPGAARRFLCEDPVKREVFCSSFSHRIVCRLLYNYLRPVLEPTFIFDSFSCQIGKGTHLGRERFAHHIRSCSENYHHLAYVLDGDLSGYFMSIDRNILLEMVRKRIAKRMNDRNFLGERFGDILDTGLVDYLTELIILRDPLENCRTMGPVSGFNDIPPQKLMINSPPGVGLAIGDITSQLFSNVYLDELDQYVKRVLKCRHYGRYVDDFYVVSRSKEELRAVKAQIDAFLKERLHLKLHPLKTRIFPAHLGVQFLGAVVLPFRAYARTRTVRKFRAKIYGMEHKYKRPDEKDLLHMLSCINSYLGHLRHFNAYKLTRQVLSRSSLQKYFSFDKDLHKGKIR